MTNSSPATTDEVMTRPGGRTAANSRKIEQSVLDELVTKGYEGLSFQSVAARAGVNRSTLYRRWSNKAEMVLQAIQSSVLQNVSFEDTGTLQGDLKSVLTDIGAFIETPVGRAIIVVSIELASSKAFAKTVDLIWDKRLEDVRAVFERARQRNELSMSDDDWEAVFAMVAGALYFRLIVMRRALDDAWIDRILANARLY
jgi:AcrR family transcriptional regulator